MLLAIATQKCNLCIFLVPILTHLTFNVYTVKDSLSFVSDICHKDSTYYKTSFDINSLFTNIPIEETIDIILNDAENDVNGKADCES